MNPQNLNKCCVCYNPEFDDLLLRINTTVNELSAEVTKSKFHGYSCDKKAIQKIETLSSFLSILTEENRKILLGGEPCLNCDTFQRLAEKIRRNTKTRVKEFLIVDDSGENAWVAQNPTCVSLDRWQTFCNNLLAELKLEVKATRIREDCFDLQMSTDKNVCDFTFQLVKNLIPCDVVLAVKAYKEACDLGLTISRTKEECRLDFEILKSETNCDIDFKTYAQLVECNLSFDIIKTIYENNCEIVIEEVDSESETCCDLPHAPLVMTCPPDAEYLCIEDVPTVEIDILNASVTGGCGEKITEPIFEDGTGPCPWNITRIFQATDECGASVSCQYLIVVDDTGVPESGCNQPCGA